MKTEITEHNKDVMVSPNHTDNINVKNEEYVTALVISEVALSMMESCTKCIIVELSADVPIDQAQLLHVTDAKWIAQSFFKRSEWWQGTVKQYHNTTFL